VFVLVVFTFDLRAIEVDPQLLIVSSAFRDPLSRKDTSGLLLRTELIQWDIATPHHLL